MGLISDIIGIGGGLIKRARAKRKERKAARQSQRAANLSQEAERQIGVVAEKIGLSGKNLAVNLMQKRDFDFGKVPEVPQNFGVPGMEARQVKASGAKSMLLPGLLILGVVALFFLFKK